MTLAEAIEGPEKVGKGVGVVAVHCPFTTTPSFGMLDTPERAITLFEVVPTTYRVSLAGSSVSPEGPNMIPGVPPLQKPVTISVNDVCTLLVSRLIRSMVPGRVAVPGPATVPLLSGAFDM